MSITREHRQESLSVGYVHCVAAMAGWTWSMRNLDYGADVTLHHVDRREHFYFESGRVLHIQLKSTTVPTQTDHSIRFDLPVSNYEWLRDSRSRHPRLLGLLVLSADERQWLSVSERSMTLRHTMYWASLQGHLPTQNKRTIRVTIAKAKHLHAGFS